VCFVLVSCLFVFVVSLGCAPWVVGWCLCCSHVGVCGGAGGGFPSLVWVGEGVACLPLWGGGVGGGGWGGGGGGGGGASIMLRQVCEYTNM